MKFQSFCALALLPLSVLLSSCGSGTSTPKVPFSALVSFGDSLSDVGSYKVGTVAALGGGKYTINSSTAQIWVEILASELSLNAPCAAQTGLNGSASQGFSVPVINHPGCTNYAQGGARVSHPVGPGNALLGGANTTLGQLTVPVAAQITNHLTLGGGFTGKELVTVAAGANDVFIQFGALNVLASDKPPFATFSAYAQQFAAWSPTEVSSVLVAAASGGATAAASAAAPIMASKMADAGNALANLIKTQIVGKGANFVLVSNIPNISKSVAGTSLNNPALQKILDTVTVSFNSALQSALANASGVKLHDVYTANTDQFNNPQNYGISNATSPACNLSPTANVLASSLVCTNSNVMAGDVSTYLLADSVHPTPFGHVLFVLDATRNLVAAGWM
jgi:outer membrane lipase/esterase